MDPTVERNQVKTAIDIHCEPRWGLYSTQGRRKHMEDTVIVIPDFIELKMPAPNLCNTTTAHLFGVFDGHGGDQVANYCRDHLPLALKEGLDTFILENGSIQAPSWEEVFTTCFQKINLEVGQKFPEYVGSTAVVAVVSPTEIIVANCGDSRAVLLRGTEAIPLSTDHKPNRVDEKSRIEKAGGVVIDYDCPRVFGCLAMSRAIGDKQLYPWVIPDPEVTYTSRANEDECLILASDGLWDIVDNNEASQLAKRRIKTWHKRNAGNKDKLTDGADPACEAAARYLSRLAMKKGSQDNTTVIVVDLKKRRPLVITET